MALQLPTIVSDRRVQQCLDLISRQFPITSQALANSAKELFPQLVVPGSRKINWGTGTWEWAGATKISKVTTVEHGLGATPVIVVITPNTEGAAVLTSSVFTKTSASYKTWAGDWFETPGAGQKFTFDWLAIG